MKPKTKIKITHKKNKSTNKYQIQKFKQQLVERMLGDFRVLGHKIYVSDIPTIFRVSHSTGILECNDRFVILDKKIQEFFVVQMLDIFKNQKKARGSQAEYNKMYMNADKKALMYVTKQYPSVPKTYWLFAIQNILSYNMIPMNRLRIENAISVLKQKKDKSAKEILGKYKEKEKEQKMFDNAAVSGSVISKLKPKALKSGGHKDKNITMRSNKMSDMSNQLRRKYPQYTIIDKGLICNNFGIGGFKYYQRFWVRPKTTSNKTPKNK